MYKKINNIYFYFFMFNMKNSIKLIFHDSKQGLNIAHKCEHICHGIGNNQHNAFKL
jgi:hypothetical protein